MVVVAGVYVGLGVGEEVSELELLCFNLQFKLVKRFWLWCAGEGFAE